MRKSFIALIGAITLVCLAHTAQAFNLSSKAVSISSDMYMFTQTVVAPLPDLAGQAVIVQSFVDQGLLAADIGAGAPLVSEIQDSVTYSYSVHTDGLKSFDEMKYMLYGAVCALPAEKPEIVLLM